MSNQPVIDGMKKVLADNFALYLKTQNYHWNVEGPMFRALHEMFEEQYTDLAEANDDIAEIIRALGEKAPGTFEYYAKATSIKPGNENASAKDMAKELADDQVLIAESLTEALKAAQDAEDEVVAGYIADRLTAHRKTKWMLDSMAK